MENSNEEKDGYVGPDSLSPSQHEPVDPKKTMRKIDLHVLPALCVYCFVSFLDRINIGNAAIFGLKEDLHLTGERYNFALLIFFIPYIILEIPSNFYLKMIKPHILLSAIVFMFGITTLAQGFVTNYGGLLTTRFFLGFFESGLYPGSFYLIAMWYRREESQIRFTFFFVANTLSLAFGGLLASAIGNMEGIRGMSAWRWVFILEGILTCVVAIVGYFYIQDFPEDPRCTWLTAEEKEFVRQRLEQDVGKSGRNIKPTLKDLQVVFTDYKFILGAIMYFCQLVPAYSFSYFGPTILRGWNFSLIESQLFTAPIGIISWIAGMVIAYFSDRFNHRYWFIIGCTVFSLIGYVIVMTAAGQHKLQYGALYFVFLGGSAALPVVVCYFQTNLAGHTRRGIGSAFQIAFGNIGGMVSTFFFVQKDAPEYVMGYSLVVGFIVLGMIATTAYAFEIKKENRRRDMGIAPVSGDEEAAGDKAADFRYIL